MSRLIRRFIPQAALALLLCNAAPPLVTSLHAQEMGRLFYSPIERAALDRARFAEPLEAEIETETVATDEPEVEVVPDVPVHEAVRVDGYVQRSGAEATVWVNGMDSHQGNLGEFGIDPEKVRVEAARVRVPVGSLEQGVLMKPGQAFDPMSETVTESYLYRDRSRDDEPFQGDP